MRLKFLPSFVKRRGRITNNQEENLKLLPDYSINTLDDIEFHSSKFFSVTIIFQLFFLTDCIKLLPSKLFHFIAKKI